MTELQKNGSAGIVLSHNGKRGDWQHWTPYVAVVWSLIYATLGIYWAVSGRGFPYSPETMTNGMGSLVSRLGQGAAWVVVIMAGIPAAAVGMAMMRNLRKFRLLLIVAGAILAGVLLFFMTSLNLLVLFGYIPYAVHALFIGSGIGQVYLEELTQWTTINQLICLAGGFLWLAATVCYARLSGDACLYCGRGNDPAGWNSPSKTLRWGRIAVYVSMAAPIFYAITRYAWVLGFPLGMSEEYLRQGQESGMWISGLFMATFGLVGVLLTFGLIQHWGEVFPRWMIGLAGRRVPMALAVIPASLISVLLVVGGLGIWANLAGMAAALAASGVKGVEIIVDLIFQVGPTLLFPVWGVALAVATLGYSYRRRGPCNVCGRGVSGESA
jgi:hypothetical protein